MKYLWLYAFRKQVAKKVLTIYFRLSPIMNIKKKTGPKTDPWTDPAPTLDSSYVVSSKGLSLYDRLGMV